MVQVASGSYTSDGLVRTVTTPGWQADMVIIKGGAQRGGIWTRDMGAGAIRSLIGALIHQAADGISANANGFSIAADNAGASVRANVSGVVYYWVAFRDNGAGDFAIFSYTGDGSAGNKTTAALSGTPSVAFVMPGSTATARNLYWMTDTYPSTNSSQLAAAQEANTRITGLVSGGISVGSAVAINASAETYWVAVSKNIASIAKTLTYNGDGTDSRNITGVGFDPQNVILKVGPNATAAAGRFKDQVGDNSFQLDVTNTAADKIQSLITDGFQVGTNASVNTATATPAYHVWALRDGTSTAAAGSTSINLALLGVG